jgi:glycosyltransferase involved in cell wall biosynthesis
MKIALVSNGVIWTPLKTFQIFKRYLPNGNEIRLFTTDFNVLKFLSYGIEYANDEEELANKIKEYSPDIIQINRPVTSTILTEKILKSQSSPIVEYLYLTRWDYLSKHFIHHISPSSFLIRELFCRENLSVELLKKFSVIPYHIDLDLIKEAKNRNVTKIKQELAPHDELLIGFLSRPDRGKTNNPIFAKILYDIYKKIKKVRIIAIGGLTNDFRSRMWELIKKGIFLDVGPLYGIKLYEYLHALDLFAYHSLIGETFGIAIAEAMAAGLPVVINGTPYRTNAQTLLVDNGKNGFVANSIKGFVDAVIYLAKNISLREKFGFNAKVKIFTEYHPKDVTEKMITLYEKIIKNEEINNNLSLMEINNEFKERSRNVFDRGIKYTLNYCVTYYYSRSTNAGGNTKAIKKFIKNSSEKIIKIINSFSV